MTAFCPPIAGLVVDLFYLFPVLLSFLAVGHDMPSSPLDPRGTGGLIYDGTMYHFVRVCVCGPYVCSA